MIAMNPRAWDNVSMAVLIADFQQADGIFSSFICDELMKQLSIKPLTSLDALNLIDIQSRNKAFTICFHPEAGEAGTVLKAINPYTDKYPILVKQIMDASHQDILGRINN